MNHLQDTLKAHIRPVFKLASMRLVVRFILAFLLTLLVGLAVLTALAGREIAAAIHADFEQRQVNAARFVAQGLSSPVQSFLAETLTADQLSSLVRNYEIQTESRLTLFITGNVESLTRAPLIYVRSSQDMPEMEFAIHADSVLATEREGVLYSASVVNYLGRGFILAQLALPVSVVQAQIERRWLTLGGAYLIVMAIAMAVAVGLARSIVRPLTRLNETAKQLAEGNLNTRATIDGAPELAELGTTFNLMAHRLQAMIEEQRAFASNTSHELRTPLTTIRLRTEALRYEALDSPTSRQYIEEIDDEIARLSNLVQDVALLSRLESHQAVVGAEELDCVRIAQRLIQQVRPVAEDRRITLTLQAPDDPVLVTASLTHVTVLFRNILDNAIKYTPDGGGVTWCIMRTETGVAHEISDTGQGIAPADLPHVFERFFRADRAHTRHIPGTGLGLALVKSIAEIYDMNVIIRSEGIGKGTTVSVNWRFPKVVP